MPRKSRRHRYQRIDLSQGPELAPRATSAGPPLDRLPNEVFEIILQQANFDTIAALRLTSKPNAARCMCPAFKKFYAQQKTNLSKSSLSRLEHLSAHPQLGPSISSLTLTAVCFDTTQLDCIKNDAKKKHGPDFGPENAFIHTQINPQIRKLAALKTATSYGSFDAAAASLASLLTSLKNLRSLELTANVINTCATDDGYRDELVCRLVEDAMKRRPTDWISLWDRCDGVLRVVITALGLSEANHIQTLDIFRSCFGKVSISRFHGTLLPVLLPHRTLHGNFATAASRLTKLSISFSPLTYTVLDLFNSGQRRSSVRPQLIPADAPRSRPSSSQAGLFARFLKLTPNLEQLDLYMYNTLKGQPSSFEIVIEHIAQEVRLPKLRELQLRGIWCQPNALACVLRNHPNLEALSLTELHLQGPKSSWDRIFNTIKQNLRKLSLACFENLFYAGGKLLPLDPRDKRFLVTDPSFQSSYNARKPSQPPIMYARRIEAEELAHGIELAASAATGDVSTRGRGDVTLMRWLKSRMENFGPPLCPKAGEDF